MKVSAAATAPRIEQNQYLLTKRIKAYGQGNDYPQKILQIVDASGTGKVCVDIYSKFISGAGFNDPALADYVLNSNKERANSLLRKCAKDLRKFGGFAMLVKYNALAEPVEYYNVPFEHCRIEIDGKKKYTGRVAVHPDWTGISGLPFNTDDIKYINRFNPATVTDEMVAAGGVLGYLGQIMYYTADGDFEYPVCPFDAIVTDMLTEESVSTVKHRNAKYNFLPSGILVRKGIKPSVGITDPVTDDDTATSADEIRAMQGDSNTAKIWVVDIDADEEEPKFIPFDAKNYDKQYEYTEGTVQDNIGRMSMIPPILRGVDVGAGFGADLMRNAYDFMNSVVDDERRMLEVAYMDLLRYFQQQFSDYTVKPLEYVTTQSQPQP
jgi:hypothetical protein